VRPDGPVAGSPAQATREERSEDLAVGDPIMECLMSRSNASPPLTS